MRRLLLAVGLLLTVSASPAFAGYLIIRVLIEGTGGGSNTAPGMTGPGPIAGGSPGGSLGGPPPGGPTSGGMPPAAGMPMAPGMPTGGAQTSPANIDHTRAVVVLIPLETDFRKSKRQLDAKRPWHETYNPAYPHVTAPYYNQTLHASLFVDSTTIQLYHDLIAKPEPTKTRATEVREKYLAWARRKDDPQILYDAMILALKSGIIRNRIPSRDGSPPKDAMNFAQELLDVAAEKKLPLSNDVERFVKAWGSVSKAVKMPAPQPSNAETWKARLDARALRVDGHYAIIYWDSFESEVLRRAAQLNDNFAAFYLLHATQGIVLPVPEKPLIAVLVPQGKEIPKFHLALDGYDRQTDAFYAPDHNLLVLAPERLDDVGYSFTQQTHELFKKGYSQSQLLSGLIPRVDPTGKEGSKPEDIARANTLALVEKLVAEEAEVAAVSREGTRQLLLVTGVLPRYVTLPNWLSNGMLNTYTRPRGPAYVTVGDDDKPMMTVAYSTGYGVPNYVLQRYFRDLEVHKELNADSVKLLEHILTDAYFAGIKNGLDPDPAPPTKKKKTTTTVQPPIGPGPGPMPGPGPTPGGPKQGSGLGPPMGLGGPPPPPSGLNPGGTPGYTVTEPEEDPTAELRKKKNRLEIKAHATSWALYYYLARAKPDQLKAYIAELNKLPRDLPIDGGTAFAAFVRVFGLSAKPDGSPDTQKMKDFAEGWLAYMKTIPPEGIDIPLQIPEPPKTNNTGPMPPMPGGSLGPKPSGN